jgi:hypothetical protein
MVKRFFIVAILATFALGWFAHRAWAALTYQIIPIDSANSRTFAALITGLTPSALSGSIGVQSQNVTFNGLVHNTDGAIGMNLLAGQNAQCPLISVRIPSDNTFAFDFLNTAASTCTPNAGTYVIVVDRVGAQP